MCSVSINNLPCGSSLLRVPLVNNGGAILALHPQTGSPLIGAGSNASTPAALTTDQRGAGFARIFGSIIDIGAIEVQPIPYPLATASISNITTSGATAYTFTVTYFDTGAANNGINMATVIGNNSAVRVLGPDGFNVPATYVSANDSTNGTPRTVTYSFTPPGGAWDALYIGNYIIFMQTGQVKYLDGNAEPAGKVATLSVKI